MPRLGWTAEAGILKEWLCADGSRVEVGDVLFTVEGDKAVEEIEALDPGILRRPQDAPGPGQRVPVGALLAYILEEGEAMPAAAGPTATASTALPTEAEATDSGHRERSAQASAGRPGRVTISPRARKLALDQGLDWQGLQGSGRTGRIVERDIVALARSRKTPAALSPVARRLAAESGLEVETLHRAFPGQRISADMVRTFLEERPQPAEARLVVPFTPTRKAIAAHLSASVAQAVPVTLHTEIEATELVRLREQLRADQRAAVPSYNVLFLKVLAHALQEHTYMNALVEEDALILIPAIHIGIAVQTERGLLVPVVRDVAQKTLSDLQQETAGLIETTLAGALPQSRLQDGTFTLTNLGPWDVDAFTPILNAPQVAILGLGRIRAKPMVRAEGPDEPLVCPAAVLSLTFDHRAVDGAPAARFLQRVKQLAEQPYLWLTA